MSEADRASLLDAAEEPIAAAAAYEALLATGTANLEAYLSLAVLYFNCTDFGYLAHHKLPEEFYVRASTRAREVLDEAEKKFGTHNELSFWRYYFDFIECGSPANLEATKRWVDQGPSRIPIFHVIMLEGAEEQREAGEQLLRSLSPPQTERERYVVSVLRSCLR